MSPGSRPRWRRVSECSWASTSHSATRRASLQALTGHAHAFAVWDWLAEEIKDGPDNGNNRFEVADRINATFPGTGPFWGHPQGHSYANLLPHADREGHGLHLGPRETEREAQGNPKSIYQLAYTGAVGSQSLVGLPMLARLRHRFQGDLGVWPMEDHALDRRIVLAEVYPSLIPVRPGPGEVLDAVQVRTLAGALHALQEAGKLAALFKVAPKVPHEEGWILGVGCEADLRGAAVRSCAARLCRTCSRRGFATTVSRCPPGVDWVPVDDGARPAAGRACPR